MKTVYSDDDTLIEKDDAGILHISSLNKKGEKNITIKAAAFDTCIDLSTDLAHDFHTTSQGVRVARKG
jgi:hypothetical protein